MYSSSKTAVGEARGAVRAPGYEMTALMSTRWQFWVDLYD